MSAGLTRGAKPPWERRQTPSVTRADVAEVQTQVSAVTAKFPVDTPDIADDAIDSTKVAPLAIGATELATDAVTNPKVAPAAMDGETITGSTIQTAASGERVVIRNDGSGGIVEFFSGLASESPGVINPASVSGKPAMFLRAGQTAALPSSGALALLADALGAGIANLAADTVYLTSDAISIAVSSAGIALNGVGTGAGMDTWQVACTSNCTATSTTNVTISGLSQAVTTPGTSAVYLVRLDLSWATAAGTSSIVELLVDGTPQTVQLIQATAGTDAQSVSKTWRITGLSASSHTFTARLRNTAGGTSATVAATNSVMTIERKA